MAAGAGSRGGTGGGGGGGGGLEGGNTIMPSITLRRALVKKQAGADRLLVKERDSVEPLPVRPALEMSQM